MKKTDKKNEKSSRVKAIVVLIGFTAIMLILSTYAWFSTQRAVTLSNLSGTVNVAEGLEISLDAANWSNAIDLSVAKLDAVTTADTLGSYSATANHVPTELKPASTIGATGNKLLKLWTGTFDGTKLSAITECSESVQLSSEANYAGYYAFDIFLRNSSASENDQQLYLSSGSSITVLAADQGGDEDTGLQNTVRLALAEYGATAGFISSQSEIIAATVTAEPTISQVAIWEPNANYHVQYMVVNADRYSFDSPSRDKLMTTYALNDTSVDEVANVYDTSEATMSSKLSVQKTVQTSVEVPESEDENPGAYVTTTKAALTDTSSSSSVFALATNKVTRIRVYIWLEGQDIDCINYASHGGGIIVNFGLEKE